MAVPPIQRSQQAAAAGPGARSAWHASSALFDVVIALLVLAVLPLAILAIPNTVSVVADLLPPDVDRVGLMRAHGLSVPATMLTVPLAAVALRRLKVAHVLVGGLALLAAADALGGFAGSTWMVAVLRVVHGVGAGLLVPATLVAVWDRGPYLRALWAGVLAASLLTAQALALWPLDGAKSWQITLQPYPLLTGVALAMAAAYLVLWVLRGESAAPRPRGVERSRLSLSAVPAAGIAALAIGTTYSDWSEGLVVVAALLSVGALLALASIGNREGRTLAYSTVAVGVVLLPSAAQTTYVEMGGLGGPGLRGLWQPFLIAAVLAVAAAILVGRYGAADARWPAPLGLLAVVAGLCVVRMVVPSPAGWLLAVPFGLLAVGAAVALSGAIKQAGVGAALFALTLCFPGVLAGYLLGTGVQVSMLRAARDAQQLVDGFVAALHSWALVGGFLVVVVIVLSALTARRSERAKPDGEPPKAGDVEVQEASRTVEKEEAPVLAVAAVAGEAHRPAQPRTDQKPAHEPAHEPIHQPAREPDQETSGAVRHGVSDGVPGGVLDDVPAEGVSSAAAGGDPSPSRHPGGKAPGSEAPDAPADPQAPAKPAGFQDPGEPAAPEPAIPAPAIPEPATASPYRETVRREGGGPGEEEDDAPTGEVPRIPASEDGEAGTGPVPVVPPPSPSPEDRA
ncbi:hypothetical protein [Thermoactinospora rubra]|uniref:hypothetical protein n=1 Tax=Thermoactinospora rubra TaxID=1088767 RepID=UPI000A11DA2A|nr:hypothetical protein [Thermoactinospora rubra]